MADPTTTVADLIRRFPSEYANRTQVLHSLLYPARNGYHWHRGELVDGLGPYTATEDHADRAALDALIALHGEHHPLVAQADALLRQGIGDAARRRAQADLLALTPGPLHPDVATEPDRSSPISTIPADATPAWRAAAEEIRAAVAAHTATPTDQTARPDDEDDDEPGDESAYRLAVHASRELTRRQTRRLIDYLTGRLADA